MSENYHDFACCHSKHIKDYIMKRGVFHAYCQIKNT
jgi:hypothetical protein